MVLMSYQKDFSQSKNFGMYVALNRQTWISLTLKTSKKHVFRDLREWNIVMIFFFLSLFPSAKIFKTHGGGWGA